MFMSLPPSINTLVIFTLSTTALTTNGKRPASTTRSGWLPISKVIDRIGHFK
jgi:hypothetical protein